MLPEVENLGVQSLWLLKKALPSREEEPDISLLIVNSKPPIYTCAFADISPKRGSVLNTRSNDFIRRYIERMMSYKRKIASWVTVRGDSDVAGEGRVVGVPMFHSWGKCTMPLTNINWDWMSNASSSLCGFYWFLSWDVINNRYDNNHRKNTLTFWNLRGHVCTTFTNIHT